MHKISSHQLTIFMLLFTLLFLIELLFFHNGSAFILLIGAFLLYMGLTKKSKGFLVSSIVLLSLSLFTMWSMQLVLLIFLLYVLWAFIQKKQDVIVVDIETTRQTEPSPLIAETATDQPFKWRNIQIERLLGDVTIDTTQTILPKGKSFISVHQAFGQVRIIVPYEVHVDIHFTTLYGEAKVFHDYKRLLNEQCVWQDSTDQPRELVIFIASWIGDVEVSRG